MNKKKDVAQGVKYVCLHNPHRLNVDSFTGVTQTLTQKLLLKKAILTQRLPEIYKQRWRKIITIKRIFILTSIIKQCGEITLKEAH